MYSDTQVHVFQGRLLPLSYRQPSRGKNWYYVRQGMGAWSGSSMGPGLGTIFHIIHKTLLMPDLNSIGY